MSSRTRIATRCPSCSPTAVFRSALVLVVGLLLAATPALAQTGSIKGTVTDAETGEPLPGANVILEDTQTGTATQSDGTFVFDDVDSGSYSLRASLVGYETVRQTVRVSEGETAQVDFELSERAIELDDVVVTGVAGGERKRALGNAVSEINAADVTEVASPSNLSDLIRGRAPGVNIRQGSAMVGGGSKIRIRGISSLSLFTEQPLVYVDGVRVDNTIGSVGPQNQVPGGDSGGSMSRLGDFDPNQIENVEILKGPSAATLYGTEASKGVIQIFTKKGSYNQKPTVNFTTTQGANWFRNAEARWPTHYFETDSGEIDSLNLLANERSLGNEVFRNGHVQGYGANLSGGTEDVRYFVGLDYNNEEGYEPTNERENVSGRVNVEVNAHPTLNVGANVGVVDGTTRMAGEVFSGIWDALWASQESVSSFLGGDGPRARGWPSVPPQVIYDKVSHVGDLRRYTSGLSLDHRPEDWFTQRLNVGIDVVSEDNYSLVRPVAYDADLDGLSVGFNPRKGQKFTSERNAVSTTFDYGGTVELPITSSVSSRTSFGFQYYDQSVASSNAKGEEFPAPGLESIGSTANISRLGEVSRENTTVGVYLQEQFGWKDRRFLTVGVRGDDNSAFGAEFDFVLYPKVSGSWVVSEEPFWEVPGVNTLRLRAAYGQSGQQPDAFASLQTYKPVSSGDGTPAVTPQSLGNPNLKPERGEEVEAGFEAGFLNDRLTFDFTYYNQTTRNGLLRARTAPSEGFAGKRFENIAEIQNSGFELLVDALALDTENVDWSLTFNLSQNNNEVVDVGGDRKFVPSTVGGRHQEGFPAFSWFSQRIVEAEFDEDGNVTNVMCDGGTGRDGVEPGGPAVSCDEAPKVFLGRSTPKWIGSVSTDVVLFDRLRLYGLVDFNLGFKQYNNTRSLRCGSFSRLCELNHFPERFDPRTVASFQEEGRFDEFVETADFAKLREVSISYTLPQKWIGPVGASRAKLTVTGRNLAIFSSWSGLDPEGFQIGRPDRIGRQGANAPAPTQIATKLSLTF